MTGTLRIIDESFGEVTPDTTLMAQSTTSGTLILKSFGKFWGLAGLRLGFVIGDPDPLEIGAAALRDTAWADATRSRLAQDAARLDRLITATGAQLVGGTSLFRLYDVPDAQAVQTTLAQHHIWSRVFPYNSRWLRLGLPPQDGWSRIEAALT